MPPYTDSEKKALPDSEATNKSNAENNTSTGGRPKRTLKMPAFKRRAISGIHGPKYQFFKREMDKRFVATYGNKLKRHRLSLRQAAL